MLIKNMKPNIIPKFLILSGAKDPDEFLNKYGSEYFKEKLENLTPIEYILWNDISRKINFDDPSTIAIALNEMNIVINSIIDDSIKKAYKDKLYSIYHEKKKEHLYPKQKKKKITVVMNKNKNDNQFNKIETIEIKILICFILMKINEILTHEKILELLSEYIGENAFLTIQYNEILFKIIKQDDIKIVDGKKILLSYFYQNNEQFEIEKIFNDIENECQKKRIMI
jgi:DNA primase